jgi:hypothetical protein
VDLVGQPGDGGGGGRAIGHRVTMPEGGLRRLAEKLRIHWSRRVKTPVTGIPRRFLERCAVSSSRSAR